MLDGNNDYLKMDNIKIFYKKYDNSSSDNVLVFLHGWGGDSSSWDFNIKELKNYFTCIVLDFPGFGISDRPNKIWNVEDYTDFLQKFVEELNIKKFIYALIISNQMYIETDESVCISQIYERILKTTICLSSFCHSSPPAAFNSSMVISPPFPDMQKSPS